MVTNKPIIAAFDFDGTIMRHDTLRYFLWSVSKPIDFILHILHAAPALVLCALGQLTNGEAKEKVLTRFIRGMDDKTLASYCKHFAQRLDKLANPKALAAIARHQTAGDTVLIISASAEDWIQPWAAAHGINLVVATQLQRRGNQLTGKLEGLNCYGPEKATRFLAHFPQRSTYELWMYGDGKSDKAMFQLADKVYKKRFS
jgi:HAD superfamily hydrolase (TIGR01490 family)